MAERSDAELLVATQSDSDAVALFFRRNLPAIVGYFMARTRDPELEVQEVLSAAVIGRDRKTIGFELVRSGWLVCTRAAGGLDFLDRAERQLVEAASRGAHLSWHRRIRRRGPPPRHIARASGTP